MEGQEEHLHVDNSPFWRNDPNWQDWQELRKTGEAIKKTNVVL
jgi:hypothetical protein